MKAALKQEWFDEQTILIADRDAGRARDLKETVVQIGFPEDRIRMTGTSEEAFRILDEQNAAIVLLDDSMGSAAFRETHARLCERHGAMGFFLFTITEGKTDDFIQFAAQARIDGLIFRPYRIEELQSRLIETFAVKWPNRYQPSLESSAFVGGIDDEIFKRALEKERRLGYRDTKTPDSKYENVLGLKRIEQAGIKQGKASFEKVRLSFRVVARNGADLEKQVPIHVIEIDAYEATFECVDSDRLENGDHVSIEAEIVHGAEKHFLRIEAKVSEKAAEGMISVAFNEGNRTRFETAMRMVTKRFKELKEFFKYAKGA